jgi:UDP:flavonoid glycosyltransferase YjiC (YdhE family)
MALTALGLDKINDIRYMLKGDRTFLWDFPDFLPIKSDASTTHVGPIVNRQWHPNPIDIEWANNRQNPLAVITFGTCTISLPTAERIARILLDIGHDVLIAAGGQPEMLRIMPREPRVISYNFAPLQKIWPHSTLLICHGGQMTVFDALYHKIPVLVMPFQPEQAHSGVCLERLGCGSRLIPAQPFRQNPGVYRQALNQMSDKEIKSKIGLVTGAPQIGKRLAAVKQLLKGYNGAETVARLLEEA